MRKSKVSFATRFCRPDVIPAPRGNGERSIFEERVVDGVPSLVVTGIEDFKTFIEASKEETLISNIIKRFELGDTSVLSRVQGFYGDVSGMPDNLAEAKNFLISMQSKFDSLPVDIKKQFDNSFDMFVEKVSNSSIEEFASTFMSDKLDLIKKSVKSEEVVPNES